MKRRCASCCVETPSLASQVPGPLAPLHYAVREGHASIVQLLLQHGADAHVVVERTLWGIPLRTVDVAAARGFSEVVALIDNAIEARQRLALSEGPLRRACARATWPPSSANSSATRRS